jgi:uncharacterized protein DUF4349
MPTDLKEFDDLIAALQAERPKIDPGFARELDNRAAAGFKKPRRRLRLPRISMAVGAPAAAFSVILALVVAVGVLSSGDTTDDGYQSTGASGGATTSDSAATAEPSVLERDSSSASAGVTADEALRSNAAPQGGANGRVQELSANLVLVAPAGEVTEVGDRIVGVVDEVGGFVVSSSLRATDGDSGGGDFQLRIPTDRLDDGLARLSRLAHVRERSQGVLDITSQRNVARERLQEARAERVSLLKRLEDATTDTEVAALRAQLRDVNDRIGHARAALTQVKRRAQFASVSVTLLAEGDEGEVVPIDDGKWTPGDALRDAGRVLEVLAGVLVVVGAVLIPLALLVALIAAMRRAAGHRGRKRVLDAV